MEHWVFVIRALRIAPRARSSQAVVVVLAGRILPAIRWPVAGLHILLRAIAPLMATLMRIGVTAIFVMIMSGPWTFCMELLVRSDADCHSDLSVALFTFTDGETGAWSGGPSVCAGDKPLYVRYRTCNAPKDYDNDNVINEDVEPDFPGETGGVGGIDLSEIPSKDARQPYPNPTTGKVYYKGEEIDLTNYPAGVHIVRIGGESHRIVKL